MSIRVRTNGERVGFPIIFLGSEDEDEVVSVPMLQTTARFSIDLIASPLYLSPKRKLLYDAMLLGTIALPMFFAVLGIIICALRFHKKKLAQPLDILMSGAEKIADSEKLIRIVKEWGVSRWLDLLYVRN